MFWWHWQDLKNDLPKSWLHGRAWLHHRPRGVVEAEWCVPSRSSLHLSVLVGGCENQLRFGIALYLFAFYLGFDRWDFLNQWKPFSSTRGKDTRFAIHNWALWWNVWTTEGEWSSKTPKWRDGSFQIADFFLGAVKHKRVKLEASPVVIPMPEGDYPATVVFWERTWKRARWPTTWMRREAEIDATPGGIPVPGKGENSWDMDDGSIMIAGSSETTLEGAVSDFVRSVHERRTRYGGEDWRPTKRRTTT